MKVKINCLLCGKEHDVEQREINRGNGKFCSISCSTIYSAKLKQEPNVQCAFCGVKFYRAPSKIRRSKSGLYFCSQECHNKAATLNGGLLQVWPQHYGTGNDYRRIAFAEFPHICNHCGYDVEVRILEVHHIDGDRKNNAIHNLEILCPNCHTVEHLQ